MARELRSTLGKEKLMGRLIDADKLKTQFPEPADWLDINQTLVHKTGIWAEIDAAETIEAIPVDWIKRYMKEVGLTDVKYMLETWEKEQIYGKTD
jgi:hypothetical protein